jgi:hypothetical protein
MRSEKRSSTICCGTNYSSLEKRHLDRSPRYNREGENPVRRPEALCQCRSEG